MGFSVYLAWFSVLVFVAMIVYRFAKFNSMPLHLRWELYPLPLEPKHHYGGSYMEELDYAQKPRHHVRTSGLVDMASEVFLLYKVKAYNKHGIWPFSFSMHWGIYLLFLWIILMLVERIFSWVALSPVTNVCGVIALILGAFGSLGILLKRIGNEELSLYTAPVDYFNLVFMFAIFGTGIIALLTVPSFFTEVRGYIAGVLSFKAPAAVPVWVGIHLLLFELFLIYMPFSKLFHYVAKYFTIDKVFWDDILNIKGSAIDNKIASQLSGRITWAAPHVVPGKTWVEEVQIVDGRDV